MKTAYISPTATSQLLTSPYSASPPTPLNSNSRSIFNNKVIQLIYLKLNMNLPFYCIVGAFFWFSAFAAVSMSTSLLLPPAPSNLNFFVYACLLSPSVFLRPKVHCLFSNLLRSPLPSIPLHQFFFLSLMNALLSH